MSLDKNCQTEEKMTLKPGEIEDASSPNMVIYNQCYYYYYYVAHIW